jgi:hypothetical protein
MADNFDLLWQRIAQIPLFGKAGDTLPPNAKLEEAIAAGKLQLPPVYASGYGASLEQSVQGLIRLVQQGEQFTVETISGAVINIRNPAN